MNNTIKRQIKTSISRLLVTIMFISLLIYSVKLIGYFQAFEVFTYVSTSELIISMFVSLTLAVLLEKDLPKFAIIDSYSLVLCLFSLINLVCILSNQVYIYLKYGNWFSFSTLNYIETILNTKITWVGLNSITAIIPTSILFLLMFTHFFKRIINSNAI